MEYSQIKGGSIRKVKGNGKLPVNDPHSEPVNLSGVWFHGDTRPEPVATIIDEMIPARGVTFLGGQSGAGKTFLATDMAAALAGNQQYFGRDTEERLATIYVAAEGRDTISGRLEAAAIGRSLDGEPLPVAVVTDCPNLSDSAERDKFARKLQAVAGVIKDRWGVRVGLVIIDTLVAAFSIKDENSAGEMASVIKAAGHLGECIGAATLVVHHYGKDAGTGLRGSSAVRAAGESVIAALAERNETDGSCRNRRLVHSKNRAGAEGPIGGYELQDVPLGVDRKGRKFGAARIVVTPYDETQINRPRLASDAELFLSCLTEALLDYGEPRRMWADAPMVRAVDLERVRALFYPRKPADGDDKQKSDARRQAFRRGRETLTKAKAIATLEVSQVQWVWLIKADDHGHAVQSHHAGPG